MCMLDNLDFRGQPGILSKIRILKGVENSIGGVASPGGQCIGQHERA